MEKRAIVVVGPTCSGKTSLGIKVAERLNSEIISADSRQIFRQLNIGTATPTGEELSRVKHHFINSLEPTEEYNVSKFEHDALRLIEKLQSEDKIPVIVGGSGLYIRAIVDGLFDEVDTDKEYRAELKSLREKHGNEYLYEMLCKTDPKSAETMLPQNWKRVFRALEVFRLSGKSIVDWHNEHSVERDIEFFQYGLNWDREVLYKNIESRVDKMLEEGLLDEINSLLEKGLDEKYNSINTVGYKEIIAHLKGEYDLERGIELIKRNTRRFAKRQFTWFGADERIKWFDVNDISDIDVIADSIVRDFSK